MHHPLDQQPNDAEPSLSPRRRFCSQGWGHGRGWGRDPETEPWMAAAAGAAIRAVEATANTFKESGQSRLMLFKNNVREPTPNKTPPSHRAKSRAAAVARI